MSAATPGNPVQTGMPGKPGYSPTWGNHHQVAICEGCNWRYLVQSSLFTGKQMPVCPHCCVKTLTVAPENINEAPYPYPPELVSPFSLNEAGLEGAVKQFARGIPYPPEDLNYAALRSRLTPIYLPVWLIDGRVNALWQAEAGFNYQVVSHQEHYAETGNHAGWQSKEIHEDRIRWEKRIGRLDRTYQNVTAPALEEAGVLNQTLGDFNLGKPESFQPAHLLKAWVRLPDRATKDAWSDAAAGFLKWAASECQQACAADHLRQFGWKAEFSNLNWTLLLLPVYTTFYTDDNHRPQPVIIHGQTGFTTGKRRASNQRAQKISLTFLAIGLVISILGLVLGLFSPDVPSLGLLAILAFVIGVPFILATLAPLGIAWDFNRRQT